MIHPSIAMPTTSALFAGGRPDVRLDTSLELLLAKMPADDTRKVLATLVATAGSTYRKPGARMLIMSDGSYLGLLSGGCLEGDLELHAQEVMDSGVPRAVEYDMRGPDDVLFGIGTGCEGAMRVLLEPAGPGSRALVALKAAGDATRTGKSIVLIVMHTSADAALGTYLIEPSLPAGLLRAARDVLDSACSKGLEIGTGEHGGQAFVQYLAPPPHVLICGAGPDAQPVARAALALGWRVTLVDHRPDYADPRRFPGATVLLADARTLRTAVDVPECHAAVVMSHHLASDTIYLRELAEAGVPAYVGLLGPAARRQKLVVELAGVFDKLKDRIRGPVGLDLGAVTPEGIALAIVSQIHAWLAQREPAAW
jgi:xanthine dehydrogenase accessory factor